MRERCNNPNAINYERYGARGITVCPEWDDFWVFLKDMGDRPEGMTLDRIKNDEGYSASNCKWSTNEEQRKNKRPQKPFTIKGALGFERISSGRYRAQISIKGKRIHIGVFDCPLMAHLAYKEAVREKLSA